MTETASFSPHTRRWCFHCACCGRSWLSVATRLCRHRPARTNECLAQIRDRHGWCGTRAERVACSCRILSVERLERDVAGFRNALQAIKAAPPAQRFRNGRLRNPQTIREFLLRLGAAFEVVGQ